MTHLMGADLNNIVKCQKLTDDHVQFLIYQILRGLKVGELLVQNIQAASLKHTQMITYYRKRTTYSLILVEYIFTHTVIRTYYWFV